MYSPKKQKPTRYNRSSGNRDTSSSGGRDSNTAAAATTAAADTAAATAAETAATAVALYSAFSRAGLSHTSLKWSRSNCCSRVIFRSISFNLELAQIQICLGVCLIYFVLTLVMQQACIFVKRTIALIYYLSLFQQQLGNGQQQQQQ